MSSNQSNNKRIAKNTLFLYFRMLLLMLISLYTSRVVLQQLGVDDFGIYNVVGGITALLGFLNGAMATGTERFLNFEMGKKNLTALKNVFSTSIQIHSIVAIIVLLLAETVGLWFLNYQMNIPEGRIVAANWVYQFSVATALLSIYNVPYSAVIIAHEKMSAFAYISIVEGALKLVIALLLILSSFDKLILYAGLIFVVGLNTRIVYCIYCSRNFEESRNITWKIDKTTMRQMTSFSGWTIFGNLGYILHTQGIAILINIFFTVSVNAAQGIANQINGIVSSFSDNFLTALKPQMVMSYAENELTQMHLLLVRGCKVAFCLLLVFVIPICLEAYTLLDLWLGVVPDYAVLFLRLVLLISLINSFSSLLASAKGATGEIKKYQITLTLIGALHLPFAWIAFALGGGPEYSMYVYIAIVIVLQAIRIWFVCRSIDMSIRWFVREVILRCCIVFILSSIVPYIIHIKMQQSFLTMVIVGMASTVSILLSTLFVALNKGERTVIIQPIIMRIKH